MGRSKIANGVCCALRLNRSDVLKLLVAERAIGEQLGFGYQSKYSVGRMNQATTTLTSAAISVSSKPKSQLSICGWIKKPEDIGLTHMPLPELWFHFQRGEI